MLSKKVLLIALLMTAPTAAFAETKFLTTYTDVESYLEAKIRLGQQDVLESDLIRTHYIVERDLETMKVIVSPVKNQYTAQNDPS
jgi:hypothetical protein